VRKKEREIRKLKIIPVEPLLDLREYGWIVE
jgi:hypothetical protein